MVAKRPWILLLSAAALIQVCLDSAEFDPTGRQAGWWLSNVIYDLYIVLTLVLLILRWRRNRETKTVWWALDTIVVSFVLVQAMKTITRLPRPSGGPTGFPSGHTTFSFALACLILESYPRFAPVWFAMAVGIGWSRIEVRAHYPYQVLTGAVLGCLIGWAITHIQKGIVFPRILPRRRPTT